MNTTKQVSCEEQLGTKGSDSTKELIEDAKAAGFYVEGRNIYESECDFLCGVKINRKVKKLVELQRQRERSLLAPESNEKRQAVPTPQIIGYYDFDEYGATFIVEANEYVFNKENYIARGWKNMKPLYAASSPELISPHPIVEELTKE